MLKKQAEEERAAEEAEEKAKEAAIAAVRSGAGRRRGCDIKQKDGDAEISRSMSKSDDAIDSPTKGARCWC